jgi:hypothetical protein
MNDPRRLRDEADSTVELLLLEAGASYRSSGNARAKTLAALGLAGSAAVSAGALSVATSSLLSKAGWAKLLFVAGVGATVAPVGYVAWRHAHPRAVIVTMPAVAPRPVARPVVAELEPVQSAENSAPAPTPPAPKAEVRATSASALAAELGALDAARTRLSSGDATGALARLDDYARAYPRGRLVLEAEVLRIDALSKAGQKTQASRRAEAFLRKHPNSVLATRVRGYVD